MRAWTALLCVLAAFVARADEALPPVGAPVPTPAPCVACTLPPLDLAAVFSAEEREKLEGGEVLITRDPTSAEDDEKGIGRMRAVALVPHAPDRVWATLTDFETWPGFMPHIDGTRITRREKNRMWVEQQYSVAMVGMRHTTIYEFDPDAGVLRWSLDKTLPTDIRETAGRWQLEPAEGGRSTVLRYRAGMASGRAVPGFIEQRLRQRSLRGMFVELRDEIARRDDGP